MVTNLTPQGESGPVGSTGDEKKQVLQPEPNPLKPFLKENKEGITWQIKQRLAGAISKAVGAAIIKPLEIKLEHPSVPEHGNYSTNVAMVGFKRLRRRTGSILLAGAGGRENPSVLTPLDFANNIVNAWRAEGLPEYIAKIEVAPPGFINISLSLHFFISQLYEVAKKGDKFGLSSSLKGKKFLLEHTSPNPQTTIMLGHLRNNFLGMTTARLLESAGAKVVKDCMDNDRGVHLCRSMFGYLVFASKNKIGRKEPLGKKRLANYKRLTDKQVIRLADHADWRELLALWARKKRGWFTYKDLRLKPDHANLIWYVLGSRAYSLSKNVHQAIGEMLKAWEEGEPAVRCLWRQILDWSVKGYEQTYRRVGSAHDRIWHESDHYQLGKKEVEKGLKKGVFRKSEGAVVSNLSAYGLPDTVVMKADGTALYHTQDLALTRIKVKTYPSDLYIWDIGVEQTLYFKQLFAMAEQLGIGRREKFYHLSYALINFKGGKKMATRQGNVVTADEVLDELHCRALAIIKKSNQELRGKLSRRQLERLAEVVAIGAIKYSLLKFSRETTIYYDIDESLALEGNSGPYLQYTYARTRSVMAKIKNSRLPDGREISISSMTADKEIGESAIAREPEELALLRMIYKYPEIVWQARENFAPNLICNYLYDLAQKYNLFYNRHSILRAGTTATIAFRLLLTGAVGQILHNGLSLLGIETPERM